MLELENLKERDVFETAELAKKKIPRFTKDWTSLEDYDPGITILELFAWFKVQQQNSMNTITNRSKFAFLNLFNIKRKFARGSETLIEVSDLKQNIIIPESTKWATEENIIFENLNNENLLKARIKEIEFLNSEGELKLEYKKFDGKRIFEPFGKLDLKSKKSKIIPEFKIKFNDILPENKKINLYFKIFNEEGFIRNPIEQDFNFKNMSEISWEYFGFENNEVKWHKLEILKDETYNFLFTGLISFKINGIIKKTENNDYIIRARLLQDEYDYIPRITEIRSNVIKLEQRDTLCENKILKKKDILENNFEIILSTNLALHGEHEVYYKKSRSWKLIEEINIEKDIKNGLVRFKIENLEKYLELLNLEDESLMIVNYDKTVLKNKNIISEATGFYGQRIKMTLENINYNYFDIIIGEINRREEYLFKKWEKTESFVSSGKYSREYILNYRESELIFGDNKKGKTPQRHKDNIKLINFASSLNKESNIKSGLIKKIKSDNINSDELKIDHFINATKGRNSESLEAMRGRAVDMLNNGEKAVTEKDYKEIVKKTPGLIINNIKILPKYYPEKVSDLSRCVTIVVESSNRKKGEILESYKINIKNYLEKFRLINTQIAVISPSYTGLDITGEVVVGSCYKTENKLITKAIEEFINKINKTWGRIFHLSDLFSVIDRLDCVSYVKKLNVTPFGNYKEKTSYGDIIVEPNGAYFTRNIDILFLRSEEIF